MSGKSACILIFLTLNCVYSYRFDCLQYNQTSCQCDTEEELIDCNSLGLKKFPPLKTRLPGYTVLTFAFNNISGSIPNERELLKHFPNLKLIDLRGNRKLDCAEIAKRFDRVSVHSDCTEETNRSPAFVPPGHGNVPDSTAPCTTTWCRLERGATRTWLKTYAHMNHAWQSVKQNWEKFKQKLCQREQREKKGLFEITR